jgi:CheY-like chemotaxis protein
VPRLLNLGVAAPMIGETLQAVVSQRLVRRLCPACATPATEPHTPAETLFHDITRERPRFRAVGCEQCEYAGFKGVMPVVEFYFPSNKDRLSLMSGDPSPEIWDRDTPVHEGDGPDHRPLAMRVLDLVVSGLTTPEEAVQVMGQGWWSSLARHYKHVGWFEGSTTDAALFARSETESELLVSGASRELVDALGDELSDASYRVIDVDPDEDPGKLLARHPNAGLLLLDLEGDDSKSSQMLKRLRQSFAWTGIPAVVLVPAEAPGLRQALEQRAANHVVPKPANAARIAEVVRSLSWGES